MHKFKKIIFRSCAVLVLILSVPIVYIMFHYAPPILMYHSVNPEASEQNRLSVSSDAFERQMRFLREHNYNVLSLKELADLIRGKKRIPPKTVVITLDDGYADNYAYAFPILKKYKIPATVFVIVNEINRPQADRLSWEQIKQMHDSGLVSIGSHCLGPEPLVNIEDKDVIRREIFESKKILEEKLGAKINCFSYPEGRFNDYIRNLVIEAGYRAAVTTNPGRGFSNADVFALKRLRISSTSDNLFVFAIEASGYYNFIREHRHK